MKRSPDDRWPSPWGFERDDEPLPKEVFFVDTTEQLPAVAEDFFHHNGCFVNGLTGRPCNMDYYMTNLIYERLDKCLALLVETYAPGAEDWQRLTDYWLGNPNVKPPGNLLANTICCKYGVEPSSV